MNFGLSGNRQPSKTAGAFCLIFNSCLRRRRKKLALLVEEAVQEASSEDSKMLVVWPRGSFDCPGSNLEVTKWR
jgi:hypothetical protein